MFKLFLELKAYVFFCFFLNFALFWFFLNKHCQITPFPVVSCFAGIDFGTNTNAIFFNPLLSLVSDQSKVFFNHLSHFIILKLFSVRSVQNFMAFLFFVTKEHFVLGTELLTFHGFDFVARHKNNTLCDVSPIGIYQPDNKVNTGQSLGGITLKC